MYAKQYYGIIVDVFRQAYSDQRITALTRLPCVEDTASSNLNHVYVRSGNCLHNHLLTTNGCATFDCKQINEIKYLPSGLKQAWIFNCTFVSFDLSSGIMTNFRACALKSLVNSSVVVGGNPFFGLGSSGLTSWLCKNTTQYCS